MDYEWEVGQEVVVWVGRYRDNQLGEVSRVTPSGLAEVGGVLYRKDGRGRGSLWSHAHIKPATPEDGEAVRAAMALRSARAEALALIEKARVGGGRHVKMEQWLGVIAALKEDR
jgi:hypothetical protein